MSSAQYDSGGGPVIPGELVPTEPPGRSLPPQPAQGPLQPYAPVPEHAPHHPYGVGQPYRADPGYPVGQPYGSVQAYPAGPLPGPAPVVMLAPEKSIGIAFLLTFLFGPLGMLYSTVVGALVMLGIEAIVTVVGWFLVAATFGFGLVILVPGYFLIWVACILWGCLAASGHNERNRAAAHAMAQSMGAPVAYR